MSKLAHSNDATMREIELNEADRGKIVTTHVNPPVPSREFDWSAYRDGDEPNDAGSMRIGRGPTEADAITDLLILEDE